MAELERVIIQPTEVEEPKPTLKTDAPGQTERPEWLPEKFQSAQDLAKAYGELENKLGESDNTKTHENETKPVTDKEEKDLSINKDAEKAVKDAGLNLDTLQEEYNEGGQLNDKSYEALEKAGIPKDYVDAFIKGQEAIATQTSNTLKQEVGGAEPYNNMMAWAADNLNEAEINSFNKTVNGKDMEATRLAIQGLNARFKNNVGDDPSLQSANKSNSANAMGYRSWAEVTAAMNDDRYSKDEAYRGDVQNKLKNSRL